MVSHGMAAEFIFVYGTLRQKAATPMQQVLVRYGEYLTDGYIQGRLYDVKGYPGAIESAHSSDKVYGELYRINNLDLVLSQLDAYEECSAQYPQPHEYIRKTLPVTAFGTGPINAWVYVFNHAVASLIPIESGDYLHYLNSG